MTFEQDLVNSLNSVVYQYIDIVSQKFNINKKDLLNMWSDEVRDERVPINSEKRQINIEDTELNKMTKPELIELCKTKKLKVSGSKVDLIKRILDSDNIAVKEEQAQNIPSQQLAQPNFKVSSKEIPKIQKKLIETIPKIEIKKNNFGHFEHQDTHLVFDSKTGKVYGKQNSDGSIEDLLSEDIEICHKYKFPYILPVNLDRKVNILDEKVEGLEDDDELEVEEEFEEEEEEFEEEVEEDDDEIEYYDE